MQCDKPAAFFLTGFGSRTVKVCIDHAEWGQKIAKAMGIRVHLDPDVPEGSICEQQLERRYDAT